MNGLIVKDDARYDHLENFLVKRGHKFDAQKPPDFVIFPFKTPPNTNVFDDDFFAGLKEGTPVFSGVRNGELAAKCAKHSLKYFAMIEETAVAIKNAVPTSEGVIAYLIANRDTTIAGSRVLVIGYGICGRDLCKRLSALGARVAALVRNREKEAAAQADGIKPLYLPVRLDAFDIIVNTVPARVFSNEALTQTGGAILIDIASEPYGFDIEIAKALNEKSANLPGIPGKFAKKTAGEILGEYVNFCLAGDRNES